MSKEALRAATIGKTRIFEKKVVEIDGVKFELRQPTIGQRGEIRNKSMKINAGAEDDERVQFDMFSFLLCAVVELTYVPGTDDRVFGEADYEALREMPAGGWFDKLSTEASALCNVKEDAVKKPSESQAKG